MSGEDGEVDDGPPVLIAFEYPPEDNGNDLLDNDEPPVPGADINNNHGFDNDNINNEGSVSEDEEGEESQDIADEDVELKQSKSKHDSKSRRGSKRRHHRKSSRHRKAKESSSKPAKPMPDAVPDPSGAVNYLVAPPVGEWATLLNMYQQQFPPAAGEEERKLNAADVSSPSKNLPRINDSKDKLLSAQNTKSQYDVDDVDPYATPEGSEDEGEIKPPKEPLLEAPVRATYPYDPSGSDNYYSANSSFPPRKRMRDDTFSGDRNSPPFRPRGDKYYNDRGGGFRNYDDNHFDEGYGKRSGRSPSDQWRGRRDRGMYRGRGGGPRRSRNDYDHPDSGYESRYNSHYNQGPPPPEPYQSQRQEGAYPSSAYHAGDDNSASPHENADMGPRYSEDMRHREPPRGGRRRGGIDRPAFDRERAPPVQNQPPERPGMICKYFREGNCLKGSNCNFAHLLPSEIKRKPELCKFYLSGYCIKGNDCDYLHEQFPCKFFHSSGNCRKGDNCRFSHAPLDEEGQKLLDKAVASWKEGMEHGQDQQQQQYGQDDQQQQQYNAGNGSQNNAPPGFYGHDSLMGPPGEGFTSPPQTRPPFMPPPQFPGTEQPPDRQGFEPPPPAPFPPGPPGEYMPPPPSFPGMLPPPPFPQPQTQPSQQPQQQQQPVPPYYPPNDLSSPPQFRPPGFPPSSPSAGYTAPPIGMPPLPPTLSAEQIHQMASQQPAMPPFAQSPPTENVQPPPATTEPPGAAEANARDPRRNANRTSSETVNGERRAVRYKLIPVLIPPPVPLSLALRLDPLDPIIRLDPRLRKTFGTSNP